MTAKESKAVASVCLIGDPELYAHGEFASVQMQLFGGYEPKIGDKMVMQSALHAAEAELGELRRKVGELADRWDTDVAKNESYDNFDEGCNAARSNDATELRQLLASDGGADGDNEGEGK